MEIVIKIPEDVYKRTIFYREFKDLNDCITTIKALENGTPLPEHHGRLIDEAEVIKSLFDYVNGTKTIGQCIDDAPTIIEVEGSDSE